MTPPKTKIDIAKEKAASYGKGKKPSAQTVQEPEKKPQVAKPENVQVASEKLKSEDAAIETFQPAEIDHKTGQLLLTDKHKQLIKTQIAPNATKEELDLFFMMAYRTRLDPLMKQLYFIKYRNKRQSESNGCKCGWNECTCGKSVYDVSYVTSIDGYRIIAHRTGDFAGIDEPDYKYTDKGILTHCTLKVYRKSSERPFAATVKMTEYNTGKNLWSKMPETMIAKVAEAHALRKAFPQDLSGIYTTDEMEQAKQDNPAAPPVPMINRDQVLKIKELMIEKEVGNEKLKSYVTRAYKRNSIAKLSFKQAAHLITNMQKLPDPEPAEPIDETDEVMPNDDFEAFAEGELAKVEQMPKMDLDEIDEGIQSMERNDAKPGAKYKETIQ